MRRYPNDVTASDRAAITKVARDGSDKEFYNHLKHICDEVNCYDVDLCSECAIAGRGHAIPPVADRRLIIIALAHKD